jgi:hypothetical protein
MHRIHPHKGSIVKTPVLSTTTLTFLLLLAGCASMQEDTASADHSREARMLLAGSLVCDDVDQTDACISFGDFLQMSQSIFEE